MFKNSRNNVNRIAMGAVAFATTGAVFAQGADPTSTITGNLATYLTDVGAIATAVLLVCYAKKLVGYLKV